MKDSILKLGLEEHINQKLFYYHIELVSDLWKVNRTWLLEKGFSNTDIYQIRIKLQLMGIDLNKKVYGKNRG